MRTTKANILESYVLVLLSVLDVPSESKKRILALPFKEFFMFPHSQMPFVHDESVEATLN